MNTPPADFAVESAVSLYSFVTNKYLNLRKPINDKRNRRSWSYNHYLRLLLALHRILLSDGYPFFNFIHYQLSIAVLLDFSVITSARNLPDGFHNECIIIQFACRYVMHTSVMCGITTCALFNFFHN